MFEHISQLQVTIDYNYRPLDYWASNFFREILTLRFETSTK